MVYKVIVWGTGNVGKMIIDELLDNPAYSLVGVIESVSKDIGKDVGEMIGRAPIGMIVTNDADAVLAMEADVVAYFGPTIEQAAANIQNYSKALRAGKNVVATAMTSWVYHKARHVTPEELAPVEKACQESGKTCLTTGIDPGFMNDIFPVMLTGVCGRVDSIRIQEIIDYATYSGVANEPMGLAAPMDTVALLEDSNIMIYAWGPTIYMIADMVGVSLERVDVVYEKWPTPERIEYSFGVVEAGHCAAVRFEIRGWVNGRPAIVIEHVNRLTNPVAPDWPRAKIEENDCYRIIVEGSPNITQETIFRGSKGESPAIAGCRATGMRAIHAIPAVVAARPGIISADELPIGPGLGTIR